MRSQPSPYTPTKRWPGGKALLACYHGMDASGSTDVTAGTLTMDRLLGQRVPLGLGFLGLGSWAGMDTVQMSLGGYVGIRDNVIVSTPLCMTGSTLAQVAAGTYDSYYTTVATKIRDLPFASAIIRIGWEFNGNWYSWKARNVETDYIAAFQHVVGVFRAVSGTNFKFLWNPDKKEGRYASSNYADPTDCYPGDSYVDYVGVDAYNGWVNGVNAPSVNANGTGGAPAAGVFPYPVTNQERRWNFEILGTPTGNVVVNSGTDYSKPFCLSWCAAFAALHNKPIIIPEWATGLDGTRQGENCGDDVYYVQQMAAWIAANNVYAHGYWDRITNDYYPHLSQYDASTIANFSNTSCRAAFVTAFGA